MSIENTNPTTAADTALTFESLGLHPSILKAITDSGYTTPTPIQAQAIPDVLAGRDLMASSQTGSGKTAAFILPALQRLAVQSEVRSKGPRVLVLTPTRELAQQVCDAANKYGKHMRLKVISILGGMPYPVQNRLLSGFVDILVATPGRLIDHLERGRIDFSRLEMLVLDEADRMLDMGFVDDVERIAAATPAARQTLLFSATLDGVVGNLAARLLKEPKRITVNATKTKHENIEQRLMLADDVTHKNQLLSHILTDIDLNQAVVFTATKRDADQLADQLAAQGHSVAALHGDMTQRERNRTLLNLRRGNLRVLVATDVAARGIDVPGISHVINFDLPKFAEDYVHRIGRTGRGGASGIAISFASNRDALLLKRIERYTEQPIQQHVFEGLEPRFKLRTSPPERSRNGSRGFGRGNNRQDRPGNGRPDNFGNRAGNNGFHHTSPDSRHTHAGNREGHRHNAGFGGNNGFAKKGNQPPRRAEHNLGNQSRSSHGGPRRQGERPSYALGRGHNSDRH